MVQDLGGGGTIASSRAATWGAGKTKWRSITPARDPVQILEDLGGNSGSDGGEFLAHSVNVPHILSKFRNLQSQNSHSRLKKCV